jgi:hypothetical protein
LKVHAEDIGTSESVEQTELVPHGCVTHSAFIVFQMKISLLKRVEIEMFS